MNPRDFATEVVRTLRETGNEALFAGGCVRDQLLGIEPADFDIATDATPDVVQKLFRRTIAVGVSFGVIEVLGPKPLKVQVATFRSDGTYSDHRRPDAVVFGTAREDALRRDFTLNGLFFDPIGDRLIDYVGGEADLRASVLRAIGDPAQRFAEDHLRLLRAVRIAARFGFTIETTTFAAMRAVASRVVDVSGERIAEELRKLLVDPHRRRGVELLSESGLLSAILPEVVSPPLDAMDQVGESISFPLAFAILLGEILEPTLGEIFERLRLSNTERDRIRWLVRHRVDLAQAEKLPFHVLKPLLAHAGIAELLELHRATGHETSADWCAARLTEWPAERINPPALVTGEDLKALGMTPGPDFKRILESVRDGQLDEAISTREQALAIVQSLKR